MSATSPRYLGHALPNGTYSLDDAVAVEFSRALCPQPPKSVRSSDEIWCARLWGMDESVLRRRVLVGCAKNGCPHTERIPCAHLKTMLAVLDPPLRLTPR